MKTLLFAIFFSISAVISITAQDQSSGDYQELKNEKNELKTLTDGQVSHGGFGALMFHYTQVDGRGAAMSGFRAGWIINHSFSIGFGGHGFFNDFENNYFDRMAVAGGYGGLVFEAVVFPKSAVHLTFPLMLGVGAIGSLQEYPDFNSDPWGDYELQDSDIYFVIEPGITLELSVVKFMRIGLGANYRYTDDIALEDVRKNALRGFSGGLTLKFGKF